MVQSRLSGLEKSRNECCSFVEWVALGCYKDAQIRAMQHKFYTATDKMEPEDAFTLCSRKAREYGYDYFGVQNSGKACWGATNGKTFNRHGCLKSCKIKGKYGTGKGWTNFVYHHTGGG